MKIKSIILSVILSSILLNSCGIKDNQQQVIDSTDIVINEKEDTVEDTKGDIIEDIAEDTIESASENISFDEFINGKVQATNIDTQMRLFKKYSGAGNVVDLFELNAEYWEQDEYDENSDFTYRDKKITMEEYEQIINDIFGNQEDIYGVGQIGEYGIYYNKEYPLKEGVEIPIWHTTADITHDGIEDLISVVGYSADSEASRDDVLNHSSMGCYIKVYKGKDKENYEEHPYFISRDFHMSHAGNGTVCISHKDGKDYLLFCDIYEMQGDAQYDYTVIYFDEEKGIVVEDSNNIEFAVEQEVHEDWDECTKREQVVPAFRENLEPYINDAVILLSMDIDNSEYALASNDSDMIMARTYFDRVWERK